MYYIGSEVEWNKITIGDLNDAIMRYAIIHYTGETLTVKKVWQDNKKIQPNTYAVSEDPMKGYTSTAPTP